MATSSAALRPEIPVFLFLFLFMETPTGLDQDCGVARQTAL